MYLVLALPVQEYRIFCNNVSFWNLHCFEKRKQDSFRFLVFSKTEVKEFKKCRLKKETLELYQQQSDIWFSLQTKYSTEICTSFTDMFVLNSSKIQRIV